MSYAIEKQNLFTPLITGLFLFLSTAVSWAMEVPIDDFPISYSQNPDTYVSPDAETHDKPLLSPAYQIGQMKQFYQHYYSTDPQGLSPWNEKMISTASLFIKKIELEVLNDFNNQNKSSTEKHYAENFKEHDEVWWNKINENMNLSALGATGFQEKNRAIAVTNTFARALPDRAPDFFHPSLPGQGFPFDNLQESAIWAGTPLYVFHVSKDKAWSLVYTADGYFAWIKSQDIAYVSPEFIAQWQKAAQQGLVAVTQTEASIVDDQQQFQFTGYIGAVFPLVQQQGDTTAILIPVKSDHNQAAIKTGLIETTAATLMPLAASPRNLIKIIAQLKNRPYGWGGAYFFNDCSQEIKSLFTPFGIWLPRNSAQQAQLSSTLDLSKRTVDERINLLKEKGHPLMTIIYIGGHVMLYIGNKDEAVMTYQNVWGLSPENHNKRYVIGQSLFLPLLKYYPERPDVGSPAGKPQFKLVFLDELNTQIENSPAGFANKFLNHRHVESLE